jgi:hypothetical protein
MDDKETRLAKTNKQEPKNQNEGSITPYDPKKLQIGFKDHGRFIKLYSTPMNLPGKKILTNRNIKKISGEYGTEKNFSILESKKTFKKITGERNNYKEKFKVIVLPKEPPVESSLYTKLSQKPWITMGKLWGNLASVGSSVALSLLNYKKDLKTRKDLQLYQVNLKNPRSIIDQIQIDSLNLELEKFNDNTEENDE